MKMNESGTLNKVNLHYLNHYSYVTIKGDDALDLLDRLTTNDLSSMKPMEHIYTILTSTKGKMIDLLSILKLEDQIILGCSKDALKTILEWIDFYTFGEEIEIVIDQKDYESSLMVFGDNAVDLFNKTFDLDMSLIEGKSMYVAFNSNSDGRSKMLIINKKYYHTDHYEIYSTTSILIQLIQLFSKKEDFDINLMNDKEFNDYRISSNIPVYPSEINENYNPLEAGLKKYISFNKGCYVGQEVITRLDSYAKVQNKLVLIKTDNQIEKDLTFNDVNIGQITSHTSEDYFNGVYKLAYVKKKFLNDNYDSFEIQNIED